MTSSLIGHEDREVGRIDGPVTLNGCSLSGTTAWAKHSVVSCDVSPAGERTHHIVNDTGQIDVRAGENRVDQSAAVARGWPDPSLVEDRASIGSTRPKEAWTLINTIAAWKSRNRTFHTTDAGGEWCRCI